MAEPVDNGLPEGSDDTEDLLDKFKDWFKRARDHSADWRKEAREDYDFVAGNQWSEDDAQVLRDQMRPVITFNRVGPIIDSVAGTEVNNRQEVRFIPREVGDVGVNDVLTGAAQWMRDECDAEDEESDAFQDLIVCGMGWTETRLDYEEDAEGLAKVERIDPLEMYSDPTARKRNLTDARYLMRVRELDRSEAEAMFPDADVSDLHAAWAATDDVASDNDSDRADAYSGEGLLPTDTDIQSKRVRLVEVQWWEREAYYLVADPQTGQRTEVDPEQFTTLAERALALGMPIQHAKLTRKVFKRAFVGAKILEQGPSLCPGHFSYQAMTGKRDRNAGTWYGLVRAMKDPQRWANKWLSQVLHIINSNAKGGLLAEKSAFENWRKAKDEWSDPASITILKDGGLGKVQPKQAITYPSGLDQMMQFAISSIRDVTGVNMEVLGMADRQQAASLEYQRKQAGITILATLFDSLRRYRKNQGRILLYLIQNYLSDGRLVRIVGEDGAKYIPLVHDQQTATYDVIVDDAPTSPNQKEAVWGTLQAMLPVVAKQMTPQLWSAILPYSPLPESVAAKIGQLLSEPNPGAQEMQQLAKEKAVADVRKVNADALRAETDAKATMVESKIGMTEAAVNLAGQVAGPGMPMM